MRIIKETYLHARFFHLLLGIVFLYLLAYIFPVLYRWASLATGLLAVGVLLEGVWLFGVLRGVRVVRVLADRFSNGEENPVVLSVENRYPCKMYFRVIDEIPAVFQRRDLEFPFALPGRTQRRIDYALRPTRRGVYAFGKVRVFVRTWFSCLERRYSFDLEQEVAVYPSFLLMQRCELWALGNRAVQGERARLRQAGGHSAFEQIKPYVMGDDPRTVNWKATAKCSRLMVNSYTEERAQQIYCLIDKGRTMQSPFQGMTMLDHAINSVLALSNVVLKKGDRAGLLTFAHVPDLFLRADNRLVQLNQISKMLYNLQTRFQETDFERLYAKVSRQIPTRSLLILFTNFETVSGLQRHLPALHHLALRHLVLVVLFENAELTAALQQPARTLKEVYFKTIAAGFAMEKRQMVRELTRHGIRVILSRPEALSVNAINAYLDLKTRQWI